MQTTPASAKRTRAHSSPCARDARPGVADNLCMSSPAAEEEIALLKAELSALRDDRMRAECMASIQADAVQLALDTLVAHPDLRGFFRMFIKQLVEESGSHAASVWLLDDA